MSDHGRTIPLTTRPYGPHRYIEAFASYGAEMDEPSTAEGVKVRLKSIREESKTGSLVIRKRSYVTLSGASAERVLVRYFNKKSKQWLIEEFIELVRDGRIEYCLSLRTTDSHYDEDRRVFDTVISNFVLTPYER